MVHNIHDIMYFNIKIISYQQFYGINIVLTLAFVL